MKSFRLIFFCQLAALWSYAQSPKIKVACIGASITYGATIENREQNSYPAQLQKMLGATYEVKNFGVSGCTLLKKGNLPYWNTPQYKEALALQPDIVIIDLGGNDSKLINRNYLLEYESDYHDLIASFAQLPSHPRIVLLLAMTSFVTDTTGIWEPVITKQINPRIQQVAYKDGVEVIDMHSSFMDKAALVPDKIHPNAEGAGIMAKRVYDVLIQKKDSSFDLSSSLPQPERITSFYGYPCANFKFENRDAKVVKPKVIAEGKPWVWRARFWGHEPQADIALLEQGFHIVYCDVAELFGNSEAIGIWNKFYDLLTKGGLSKKAALEGMSRGAVYAFNWAAANPTKVSSVYVDNPVLDLKSWPGDMGRPIRSKPEYEQFKKDYQLTDEQVKTFAGSPIDKTAEIVKGKYPILILCADADEAVAPGENTVPFEQEIKALHGDITVVHKPGFKHHPHSLPNPGPIVNFILNATYKR